MKTVVIGMTGHAFQLLCMVSWSVSNMPMSVTEDVCGFSLDTRQATGQVYPSRDTRQEMYCMDTEQDIDISVHAHEGSRVPGNVLNG